MQLAMYEYLEVNLIGVALLLTMFLYGRRERGSHPGPEQKYFTGMIALNAMILLADNAIYLFRGHAAPELIAANHGVCVAYFAMQVWFCYCWELYAILRIDPRRRFNRAERGLLLLPALACSLLAAASPATGWLYSLSATNTYRRGPLMFLISGAAILYWGASSAFVLRERLHPSRGREAREYRALLLSPLPSLAGTALQLRFYGLSIVWVCAAISMLILFIDLQHDRLSRDALTGLFNRRQTNAQLQWEAEHLPGADDLLFVAMIDVDRFKQINDRYGHLAGDRTLAAVADVLRSNCRKSDFVSRFGGDEFVLLGHVKCAEDADAIMKRITDAVETANGRNQLPCALSLSIGYVLRGRGDAPDPDELLNGADRKMYVCKNRKRS